MVDIQYKVQEIATTGLEGFNSLNEKDEQLIPTIETPQKFNSTKNFIELSYFTLDGTRVLTIPNHTNYSILSGDGSTQDGVSELALDPLEDYKRYNLEGSEVQALYNLLDYPFSTTKLPQEFYIESISSDRTEIQLLSTNLSNEDILNTVRQLKDKFEQNAYSIDLNIYFGENLFYSCLNIDQLTVRDSISVVLKLAQPLPGVVTTRTRLNIVERVAESVAYEINTQFTQQPEAVPTLRGANFNIEVDQQTTEPSQYFNIEDLFSYPTNNSNRELNSLISNKGAELGTDYSDYRNFINFSSTHERLLNFKYKLDLIESYQISLNAVDSTVGYTGTGKAGSRAFYQNKIEGIVNNFDHYERFLYYENDSNAWPKTNTTKPYINALSNTPVATTWYNAKVEQAILYDAQNPDILVNTIPSYLREDSNNLPYETFIHMIAQHFDNIWIYTDAVSKKYDNDNRLNKGISKDLVEEALKNFGVKLYTSNKSATDLFKYFTVNSYDVGQEQLSGDVVQQGQPLSQNDYQKEVYKRIYHNLPLLMKSKGTVRGVRALINCFGIPSDVLKVKIFGGQSSNDLPFFGGEQAFTGSIDKVRLDNTGSVVEGNTLSYYTSIVNPNNEYTQDLHRIEIGFSPSDNIDQYIVSQSQVISPSNPFNIDQYIGDPREISTNRYTELQQYATQVLDDVEMYDVRDFVRLIKFFDNVLFRMVRDFIPARSVADTGIIIKPHLLDRSKYQSPVMTWTQPEYSGSIDTSFVSGSHGGAYNSVGAGAVSSSKFDGQSSTAYRELVQTPLGQQYKTWENQDGLGQARIYDRSQEQAKFDGELSGSTIQVSDGELNRDNPFKQLKYSTVKYDVAFYNQVPQDLCLILPGGTPYIIRPEDLAWNLALFFQFGNNTTYNYTVDGFAVPQEQESNFEIAPNLLEQYQTFTVVATKELDGTCTATTEVMSVRCNMVILNQNIPTNVNSSQDYYLDNWFNINDNTESSIYVNDTPINTIPHNFTQQDGEQVTVTLRDDNDSTCYRSVYLQLSDCNLVARGKYTTENGIIDPTAFIYLITQLYNGSGQPPYNEVSVPDLFDGTNTSTTYQLFIQYRDQNTSNLQYTDGLTITPSPHLGVNGEVYDGATGPLTVPHSRSELFTRYYNDLPQNVQNATEPLTSIISWYIQATQPLLQNCIETSISVQATQFIDPVADRSQKLFAFVPQAQGSDTINGAGSLCEATTPNKIIYVNANNEGLTPAQIVQDNIPVFAQQDATDLTPAEQGYYKIVGIGQPQGVYAWDGQGNWSPFISCT